MTQLTLSLTTDEQKWLQDWSTLAGYDSASDGIKEVLKTCGGLPRGSKYWKERFAFAE